MRCLKEEITHAQLVERHLRFVTLCGFLVLAELGHSCLETGQSWNHIGSHSVRLRTARLLGAIAMFSAKMTLSTAAVAMLIGAGTLVATAGTASAYIVCNSTKDCWHTDQRAEYPAKLKAQVHPDDWYFHQTWSSQTDRNFRDYHEGNGYYLNGIWIEV